MSYLGRGLEQVDNISKLDNITFNGGTTYALTKDSAAFTPISSNAILISIDGVVQQGNFSVSGTNIVFNFSPTGSNTCDFIMHYGTGVAFTPADSSITKDKTDFISTSSAAGLQIKGDGTTDGTLQLNCSQNSHGVKIKSPAHSASQSYTLTLPTTAPATDKIMQTDSSGNLSFIDTPSGKLVFLTRQAATSSVGALYFDNVFTATYNHYICVINTLRPVSDGDSLRGRVNYNGSPKSSAKYRYISDYTDTGGTRNMNGSDSDTEFKFADSVKNDSFQGGYAGVWNIFTDIGDTSDRCSFRYMGSGSFNNGSGNAHISITGGGYFDTGHDEINGMDFYYNSGSIAQYDIAFYGVIKS